MGSGTYKAYMSFSVLSIIPLLLSFPLEYIYPFLLDFPTNLLYMESHQVVCWLWNQKTQAQFKLLLCDSLLVSSLGTTGPVFIFVVIVQLLSNIWLFATPWAAAYQASLSFTTSLGFLRLMSIESVMPSNHLVHFRPLLFLPSIFPSIRVFFPMSQLFTPGGQSIGASASASVLPMNIQGWYPLGLTVLISLLSKGLLRDFSSTTVRRYQFFSAQPSLWSTSIHDYLEKPQLWLLPTDLCWQ